MLAADISLTTSVRTPETGTHAIDFWIGEGTPVSFATPTKGSITLVQPGQYRYTPDINAVGLDNFTATYQPGYGGGYGGGYGPPPVTKTMEVRILFPFGASNDEGYANPDPNTNTEYPTINYFVLKDNTLSVSAQNGVLKNDTNTPYVSLLTAHQVGNGQYGSFSISSDGSFTYTPNSGVFDSPTFNGLTDTCMYYAKDAMGNTSQTAEVKVDLAEIYIKRGGADVDTNPSQLNVWVGEKVALSVGTKGQVPAIPGMISYQWCIGGMIVDGYTGYSESDPTDPDGASIAEKLDVTLGELDSFAVDFYWVDSGTQNVSLNFSAYGQIQPDDAAFSVNRPEVSVSVEIHEIEIDLDNETLSFGTPEDDGIIFTRSPELTQPSPGNFRWTQIVHDDFRTWRPNGGLPQTGFKPGGVDNNVNYAHSNDESAWDSPATTFDKNGWSEVGRFFSASMYLMWKHDSNDSIWTPLQVVHWDVTLSIRKEQGAWIIGSGCDLPTDAVAVDTHDFPTWNSVYVNGPYTNI